MFSDTNWVPWFFRYTYPVCADCAEYSASLNITCPDKLNFSFWGYILLLCFWHAFASPRDRWKQGQCLAICQGLWSQLKGVFQQKGVCFGGESYDVDTSQHCGLKPAGISVVTRQSAGFRVGATNPLTEGTDHLGRQSSASCSYSSKLIWFPNFNTKSIFLMGA